MTTPAPLDPAWRAARNILLVRLDSLGDVLLTTPAIRAVRAALPGARLTLLTSLVGGQVGALNPDLDAVITYRAPWTDTWGSLEQDPARERRLIAEIARHRFDAAIIFTTFRQSPLPAAYLCYLAGIPLRLGSTFDGAGSLLTTRQRRPESLSHEVERCLDLVGAVGIPPAGLDLVLEPPAGSHAAIAAWRAAHIPAGRPLAAIHPGCSMPARTYPWEQFAAIGDGLVGDLGAAVVITGSDDEGPLTGRVCQHMEAPALDLAGMAFPDLCALIAAADVVITNNTGPMHIAAALKTPVVALFALTNPPEQWGPWRTPHRLLTHEVPCRLCYSRTCPYGHECLRNITPASAVAAAAELLRAGSSRPAAGYEHVAGT